MAHTLNTKRKTHLELKNNTSTIPSDFIIIVSENVYFVVFIGLTIERSPLKFFSTETRASLVGILLLYNHI